MSKNQINKYVWLVETLYKAKKITLKEINRRWLDTDLSEGLEIPRRTFHTWKNAVEDMFGLVIMCDKSDGDRYYIENREVLEDDSLQRWLLSTMSVNNTLLENKALSDRILLESIPSGQRNKAHRASSKHLSSIFCLTSSAYAFMGGWQSN